MCVGRRYIRARARTIRGAMPLLTYHSIFGNVAPFVFNHLRKFLSSWLEIPDVPSPELLLSWWLISLLTKIQIFVSFFQFGSFKSWKVVGGSFSLFRDDEHSASVRYMSIL